MPLPPKEMYTIAEIASLLSVPVSAVEDYLKTGKLQASIFLPQLILYKYTRQLNLNCHPNDDDPYIFDIDYEDPDSMMTRQGIFNLRYQGIEWSEDGQAKLEKGDMYLTLPNEEGVFGFYETFLLNRDDVCITLSELKRFAKEYDIIFNDMALQGSSQNTLVTANSVESSSDSTRSKSLQHQKDNAGNDKDQINPKRETTLLTIIAALLEIISGEFASKEVAKHPSIRNQEDLIDKLAELETRGLSKRNLQGIFASAKETKSRS